jgi:hypothetical protein
MSKYKIGQRIPRENKTSLVVFEITDDGGYLARTIHKSVRLSELPYEKKDLEFGKTIELPNGRKMLLVGVNPKFTDLWDIAHDDRIEVTEAEIDEALADLEARKIYYTVATRRESGGDKPGRLHFLPKRMEPREDD